MTDLMHAVWAGFERGGGDVRGSVRASEATQAAAIRAVTDYYATRVLPFARVEQRPSDKYLALALLYKLPGLEEHVAHAALQNLLPDLRMLKHYNLAVHKFTSARRYVNSAARAAAEAAAATGSTTSSYY